jgi:hypothetical protein
MDLLWQPDLFASRSEVTVDADFGGGQRTQLDAGSWIEVFPGWLSGANALLGRLADDVPWQEHYRWVYRQKFLEPVAAAADLFLVRLNARAGTGACCISRRSGAGYGTASAYRACLNRRCDRAG